MTPTPHTYVLNQKLLSLGGDLWIEDEAGVTIERAERSAA